MKTMKRISKVTLKTMTDSDPDTSYLGAYSSRAETDYSIDREHSLECQINNPQSEGLETLSRVMHYLTALTYEPCPFSEDGIWDDVSDAQDLLIEKQDELQACDCSERGDKGRGEFQYFNPNYQNYAGLPQQDIRKYCRQDYERMEALNRGDFCFVGIRAEAEILIPSAGMEIGHYVRQEITSGGLWGVESDSDAAYLKEIEDEQVAELREQLEAVGFSKRAISTAVREVIHER